MLLYFCFGSLVCLSVYLSICLSVCLSVFLSVCLSVCLSAYFVCNFSTRPTDREKEVETKKKENGEKCEGQNRVSTNRGRAYISRELSVISLFFFHLDLSHA